MGWPKKFWQWGGKNFEMRWQHFLVGGWQKVFEDKVVKEFCGGMAKKFGVVKQIWGTKICLHMTGDDKSPK